MTKQDKNMFSFYESTKVCNIFRKSYRKAYPIHRIKKDGGMSILPGCIAGIK